MKKLLWGFLILLSALLACGIWIFTQIPSAKELRGCLTTKMYQVHLCPGSKNYTPLFRISKHLVRSVIISEDASFWTHHGFDWNEIENSLYKNLEKGEYARGGSTITQQLAKNMFLSKEKSIFRKLIEALITVQIEKNLTKKEILERYLNVVEFGKGVFGVQAAAQAYFKKSPAALDVLESTFLTMILPSPIRYSKSFHQKSLTPYARKRMKTLLERLLKVNHLSEAEYNEAYLMLDWFLKDKAPNDLHWEDEEPASADQSVADPVDGEIHSEPSEEQQNESL